MIDFLSEKPKMCVREGRRHGGEDRISLLPDSLLCQILFNLPTKDVVKTSLLSTRWRSLWLYIPVLDLDDAEFPNYNAFVSFVDWFIDFSVDSTIEKLKLASTRENCNPLAIKSWVDAAVRRRIQHLEIDYSKRYIGLELLSIGIFVCETLVCLRLLYVELNDFDHVTLPRLKTMYLEDVRFVNDVDLETLIASCPVLEDLSIIRSQDDVKVLRVYSQTITRLNLVLNVVCPYRWDDVDSEVVIDAPRLEYLSLKDNLSTSFTINSLSSFADVDIAVDFNVRDVVDAKSLKKRNSISNFLTKISSVGSMTISGKTLKVLRQYLKVEALPQFYYMSKLHATIFAADLDMLPDLLESCPNLKSLVLELNCLNKKEQFSFSSFVPLCMKSCLEFVEMKKPISGFEVEMELIRYLLENSTVLKKLTLSLGCPKMKQESLIFMELLRFRRCSSACEVHVAGLEETLMKL